MKDKSPSVHAEATNENSPSESLLLNKCNYRSKKTCGCKSSMIFAYHHTIKQFEVIKLNFVHTGYTIFGTNHDKSPKPIKNKAKE